MASFGGEDNKVPLLRTTKSGGICYSSLGVLLKLPVLGRAADSAESPAHTSSALDAGLAPGWAEQGLPLSKWYIWSTSTHARADTHRRKLLRITHPDFGSELAGSTSSRLGGFLVVWAKISLFFWR